MNAEFESISECPLCASEQRHPYSADPGKPWYGKVFRVVQCEKCKFVYTPMRPTMRYRIARGFTGKESGEQRLKASLRRPRLFFSRLNLLEYLKRFKPNIKSLFDVGCGAGAFMKVARDHGLHVEGCDLHDYLVEWCNDAWRIPTYLGPTIDLELDQRFDAVSMIDYLEHTYTPREDLKWAFEHMNPGGALLLRTLYLECPKHVKQGPNWDMFFIEHFNYFPKDTLFSLLWDSGFTVLDQKLGNVIQLVAKKNENT
jgi:SAM-dependent methyltransferase